MNGLSNITPYRRLRRPVVMCVATIVFVVVSDFFWVQIQQRGWADKAYVKRPKMETDSGGSNATEASNSSVWATRKKKCLSNDIFAGYFHSPERNQHQDFLTRLWLQDNDKDEAQSATNNRKFILIIGDSLDRIMLEHSCTFQNGNTTKLEPNRESSRPNVCRTNTWTAGYLNIFGMHRQCQPDTLKNVEPQQSLNETTAERIARVLPQVLDLMQISTVLEEDTTNIQNIYVQVGSNLWDLSTGCNNRVGITEDFQREYRQGIAEVYHAIHDTFRNHFSNDNPNVHVLWKLAAPVSSGYSTEMQRKGYGRVRTNQKRLNEILTEVVSSNGDNALGSGMVDWWSVVMLHKRSEKSLNKELQKDGRHYSECPSLVFFNALLEKIHDLEKASKTNY